MKSVIKITKSLEDSDVLIDGITETVKGRLEGRFFSPLLEHLATLLVQPLISSAVSYTWKRS